MLADARWLRMRILTYADVCSRMLTYPHVSSRILAYAGLVAADWAVSDAEGDVC